MLNLWAKQRLIHLLYLFDDEYDLILAIIQGLKNRGQQGDFSVKRLMLADGHI